MHYVAGFSGLGQITGGDTIDIAARIPGAAHFASQSGLSDWREVAQHLSEKEYESISLFGLSNGALSCLYIQAELHKHGIAVDYLGLIDVAYSLRAVPKVMPNVRHVQEFWSQYKKAKAHDDFSGFYEFFDLNEIEGRNVGHSEAARVPFTQNSIVEAVLALRGEPEVTDKFYIGEGRPLEDSDFIQIASEYGLSEAHVRAVVEVEVGPSGKGSHSSGALVCLYEPHVAHRNTSGETRDALVKAGLAYPSWKRNYPKTSYPRIDRCVETVAQVRGDYEAGVTIAALSTSWGLGQILGENYKLCGYASPAEMVRDFARSEARQLRGMMEFIKSANILDDLKAERWSKFARGYNGSQYAKHNYHGRLEKAFKRWTEAIGDRGDIIVVSPTEPLPEPPAGDIEAIEAHIREQLPDISQDAVDVIKGLLLIRGLNYPPPIEGETIAPTDPAIEQGFFIPTEKETDMAFTGTKSLFRSKTIWGLGAAAVSIFVPQLAPIVDILAPSAADVPPEAVNASKEAIETIVTSIQNIIASASLLYAAWGRKVATDRIE